jgi:GNAT superfamily N-acetyltransferase
VLNTLHVTEPLGFEVDAAAVAAELDRRYDRLGHRRLVVDDDATGRRLASGLADLGYACSPELVMTLSASRDRDPPSGLARECTADELRAVERAFMRAEGRPEDLIDELLEMRGALWRARPGTRWFVAGTDSPPILAGASATLYSDGVVAQVEDVGTLPELRGRGLARAVVSAATDAAVAAGHELVFLAADAGDWPHRLYAKLGFREAGRGWACLREGA